MVPVEEVRRIARLARLSLAPDEEAALAAQLSRILEYIDLLEEIDAEPPPGEAADPVTGAGLRPDLVRPGIPRSDILALGRAADLASGTIRVPAVLDREAGA